ncbi:hypothetical protein BVY03_03570, partial [bacterium K02(2017)]
FEYGAGQLLKDFEDNIKGMKKLETKNIELTFPEDYFEKQLANKHAKYKITLKNLHTKKLPKLDDEMAKDIGKETLDEVKEELKKSLLSQKEQEHRRDYSEVIKDILLKTYDFEIPQGLVDAEIERSKKDKEEVLKQLRLEFILHSIAQREKMQATPQDIEQRLNMLAQLYRQPAEEIRKLYAKNNMQGMLASQIVLDKTMDLLVDHAKMV